MESISPLKKSPSIEVTSHGIETARYNSLLHLTLQDDEYALIAAGNRLVLFAFKTNKVVIDQKIMNDAIMVVVPCGLASPNILLCSYDGKSYNA